jgi:hypothetical protein
LTVIPGIRAIDRSLHPDAAPGAVEAYVRMRDFIADWNKWSRAERVLAVVAAGLMAALPIGLALAAAGHA